MVKRGNKKGQFYLIAGIVIAVLIIGVAAISTYIIKESDLKISDLKEEVKIESSYVMDYALINEPEQPVFYERLINFTKTYTDYFKGEKSHYFIFGDQDNMTVSGHQKEELSVYLNDELVPVEDGNFTLSIDPEGAQNVILRIDDNSYSFPISQEGKNFYFVISQSVRDEEHIITG